MYAFFFSKTTEAASISPLLHKNAGQAVFGDNNLGPFIYRWQIANRTKLFVKPPFRLTCVILSVAQEPQFMKMAPLVFIPLLSKVFWCCPLASKRCIVLVVT